MNEPPRSTRILRALRATATEHLGYKLLAFVLALLFFVNVKGAGVVTRTVEVPLTALLPPMGAGAPVLLTPLPDSVRVVVRGPGSLLGALRGDQLGPIQLDLRDGRARRLLMEPDFVRLPRATTVVGFQPESLDLRWDAVVARVLSIRASLVGSPAPRTRLGDVSVEPERTRVRGPATLVDPLEAIHTEPLDVTGLAAGRYERRVALESRHGVELGWSGPARVGFEIVPLVAERRFTQLAVEVVGAGRATVRPPVVDVVVRGDPETVEALVPSQVVPFVAPDGDARGVPVRVQVHPIPGRIASALPEPGDVVVTVGR